MKKQLLLILLGCTVGLLVYCQNINQIEYFIDSDPGFGKATPISFIKDADVTVNFSPDITSLPVGIHNLFVRSLDANGNWSVTNSSLFYCAGSPILSDVTRIEYFIDTDPGFGKATSVSFTKTTDVNVSFSPNIASLPAGIHNLYVRSLDANGNWSVTNSSLFYYAGSVSLPTIQRIEYFFDTDPGFGNATALSVTPAADIANETYTLNTSALNMGTHNLFVRSLDANGSWSITNVISFEKSIVDGVQQLSDITREFTVYPNPAKDVIKIKYPFDFEIMKIDMIDIAGRGMQLKVNSLVNEKQIDVSRVKSGNYFISIMTQKGLIYKKIIVKQ